jgi:preprotein translocase subunit SecD
MNSDIKQKAIVLAAVVLAALLFLYPTLWVVGKNVMGKEVTAQEKMELNWLSKPISLGLDLSGGVHLLYRVLSDEAVVGRLQVKANTLRSDLRKQKIAVTRAQVSDSGEIEIHLFSARHAETAKNIIAEEHESLDFVGQSELESGRPVLRYRISEKETQEIKVKSILQAVETLRNRVDEFGVAEPLIQRVGAGPGADRILLQMPGYHDIEAVKKVVGRVARLEFRLLPRPGSSEPTVDLKDRESGASIKVEELVQLTGEYVDDARVSLDQRGQREVLVSFTSEGRRIFGKVTGDNVGRQLAIILDGEVYSAPKIQEPIRGGHCSITGGFSTEEARELMIVLRAGALPAPLEVMEERTVGPSLGAESIRKGLTAILISFALVIVFMIAYYRKSGAVAVSTLLLNVVLVVAALSAFGATLTLPGLAGLALTVGMAVDANVIIFERIREEIRNGSSRDAAVAAGFDKALSAIVDSNLTTLLAGVILYYFGTGPIRGFAVTLSIGIITTIFCATFVARLAFDLMPLRSGKELSI